MSRRNQGRRRRASGRRQHDLRQRRGETTADPQDRQAAATPDRQHGSFLQLPATRPQEEAA